MRMTAKRVAGSEFTGKAVSAAAVGNNKFLAVNVSVAVDHTYHLAVTLAELDRHGIPTVRATTTAATGMPFHRVFGESAGFTDTKIASFGRVIALSATQFVLPWLTTDIETEPGTTLQHAGVIGIHYDPSAGLSIGAPRHRYGADTDILLRAPVSARVAEGIGIMLLPADAVDGSDHVTFWFDLIPRDGTDFSGAPQGVISLVAIHDVIGTTGAAIGYAPLVGGGSFYTFIPNPISPGFVRTGPHDTGVDDSFGQARFMLSAEADHAVLFVNTNDGDLGVALYSNGSHGVPGPCSFTPPGHFSTQSHVGFQARAIRGGYYILPPVGPGE